MAKQKGIIKLAGTIGDVTFYKSKDGYLAREKGGVDGDRIKNDPAFQRTRENGSEFGRAGKSRRILRNALRLLIQNASDSKVTSRLTKEILRVIKSDSTNARGERVMAEGDLSILNGFDFNANGKLSATLYAAYTTAIDRAAGSLTVTIPAFIPGNTIAFPTGATHVKVLVGAAEVDFENESFQFDQAESAEIVLGPDQVAQLDLVANVTANTELDLFLVLGLDFLQEVNGVMYPMKNGSYNPLTIVEVGRYVAPDPS
ncbi:hypothetical protein [Reichenbachiella sp. MALMAid0571]|uniref:hypothetical protein n=1 Tax=Reichenbachiella sp. MALMAid0571 TaxID=3143939 RepID=UPI0032DFC399